jgi:hypothetical protein
LQTTVFILMGAAAAAGGGTDAKRSAAVRLTAAAPMPEIFSMQKKGVVPVGNTGGTHGVLHSGTVV